MDNLISANHQRLYAEYYASKEAEAKPNRWASMIEMCAVSISASTILDYGCGKFSTLKDSLPGYTVFSYDPAFTNQAFNDKVDLVVCLDVLEHVEPDKLDNVIEHLSSLALKGIFLTVSTQPSTKLLPDGSNWHSIVKPQEWWEEKLKGFRVMDVHEGRLEVVFYKRGSDAISKSSR